MSMGKGSGGGRCLVIVCKHLPQKDLSNAGKLKSEATAAALLWAGRGGTEMVVAIEVSANVRWRARPS